MPTGFLPRGPPLLLVPLLAVVNCLRPNDDVVVTSRGSLLQTGPANKSWAQRHGRKWIDSDIVPGVPFVPNCDQIASTLDHGQACNVDEFASKGLLTALELDCQLNKAQGGLKLFSSRYTQLAKAKYQKWWAEYKKLWHAGKASSSAISSQQAAVQQCMKHRQETEGSGKSWGTPSGPTWCDLHSCPSSCPRCVGQMHFATGDGRQLIMLPQPYNAPMASSYAYDSPDGTSGRVLNSSDEVTHFDFDNISKGIWFATILGEQDALDYTNGVNFDPGVQTRLRYLGNDPAIYLDFTRRTKPSEGMCIGGPNINLMDRGNKELFLRGEKLEQSDQTPFWEAPETKSLRGVASQVVLDFDGHPMGTLRVDINMSTLGKRFFDNMRIVQGAYAAIVDPTGRIIALSERGREVMFGPNITVDDILGGKGRNPELQRCRSHMTRAQLKNCTWHDATAMQLGDALDPTRYSGANYTGVLDKMFGLRSNCSLGMKQDFVFFPKAELNADKWHLVAFCALSSVPDWGLILGAAHDGLTKMAHMTLLPSDQGLTDGLRFIQMSDRLHVNWKVHLEHDEKPKNKMVTVILHNDGRVPLPWQVLMPAAVHSSVGQKQDVSFGAKLYSRPNRSLLPGEKANLNFLLTFQNTSDGRHTENIVIKANDQKPSGACFTSGLIIRITVDISRKEHLTFFMWVLKVHGRKVLFSLFFMCVMAAVVPTGMVTLNEFRRRIRNESDQKKKIHDALQSVNSVCFPMVLLSATSFKSLGKLVSHETLQRLHKDIWLHTVEEVKEFSKENKIIFVSHQWTAFSCPDPTNVQYEAMVMSIETLRAQEGWAQEEMYVWADYSSIPQKHRGIQGLAINSLTTYASNVAAFVVVAPPVQHADLGEICDKHTYQLRAWCRAEQLSHLLALGHSRMYLAERGVLTKLASIDNWLDQSNQVFSGNLTCCRREHEGMDRCDKELLVVPMLGLWAQLCNRCRENPDEALLATHQNISKNLDQVFPRTFTFTCKGCQPTERQLFGDLLDRLPEAMSTTDGMH